MNASVDSDGVSARKDIIEDAFLLSLPVPDS